MTDLQATVERHELPLESTFRTSRAASETASVVAVELEDADSDDDRVGIGAASPSAYYGEDADSVEAALPELIALLESFDDPPTVARGGTRSAVPGDGTPTESGTAADAGRDPASGDAAVRGRTGSDAPDVATVEDALREARPADAAARAALSIALHDLAAKRRGLPLHRIWALDPGGVPPTSFTLGIDEPDAMAERARAAVERGHQHLKVKLGSDAGTERGGIDREPGGTDRGPGSADGEFGGADGESGDVDADSRGTGGERRSIDGERLSAVREAAPEARLRVDPNCAWDRDTALERLPMLAEHGVELLEQPVPAADVDALRAVTERAPMPVAADEACVDAEEVAWVADACDVVVCKVAKCGGLAAARRQIAAARWHDLDVVLGCMVESHASIAAAWQLASLATYVDLDGALLLAEDPYEGLPIVDGAADLAGQERPGTGARRRDD